MDEARRRGQRVYEVARELRNKLDYAAQDHDEEEVMFLLDSVIHNATRIRRAYPEARAQATGEEVKDGE